MVRKAIEKIINIPAAHEKEFFINYLIRVTVLFAVNYTKRFVAVVIVLTIAALVYVSAIAINLPWFKFSKDKAEIKIPIELRKKP